MKAKYLKELIIPDNLIGDQKLENLLIRKIVYDSRKAEKMSLFVAVKGYSTDGHQFLHEAEQNGAIAAIVEKKSDHIKIPQYVVQDSRKALAQVAAKFYHPELERIRLFGITGTNGKTTTSFLVRSMLNTAGLTSGLIGTIHYDIGGNQVKAWNTTPESVDLFTMIYDMYLKGQKGCVLEASSHGLALHRLDFLKFDIAIFTNLSQDHLDFHQGFEDYFQAKKILFSLLKPGGQAIINADNKYGRRLFDELENEIIDFGFNPNAIISVLKWKSNLGGLDITFQTPQGHLDIFSPLIGKFNIENILATVATGIAMNFDLDTIKHGIESVSSVPGRLEPVSGTRELNIFVDYSHTPDALQKALQVLGEITNGTLWVVFGCGGDRDKLKRPIMGNIAEKFADRVIITSDNPRSEPPQKIIEDILQGIKNRKRVKAEVDRRKAIQLAVQSASQGDTILIAGKGHEDYQEIMGVKYPFDDREVIREVTQ